MKVLLVEDNDHLRDALSSILTQYGYEVVAREDGEEGLEAALVDDFQIIVLDVMMPKKNGWDVLKELRSQKDTPVIMLTARDSTAEKISAFEAGADDYMVKPFEAGELIARMKSIAKRSNYRDNDVIEIDNIKIDKTRRTVTMDGEKVDLSSTEFGLVEMFVNRRGEVISRSYIYQNFFSEEDDESSNILDVYIYKLRRKLGKEKIKTKRGYGYIFSG